MITFSTFLISVLVLTFFANVYSHVRAQKNDAAVLRVLYRVDCYLRVWAEHWGDDPVVVRRLLKEACEAFEERRKVPRR